MKKITITTDDGCPGPGDGNNGGLSKMKVPPNQPQHGDPFGFSSPSIYTFEGGGEEIAVAQRDGELSSAV